MSVDDLICLGSGINRINYWDMFLMSSQQYAFLHLDSSPTAQQNGAFKGSPNVCNGKQMTNKCLDIQ